jgi:putative glycosyltransferase (TIGR04348 family)
VHSTSVVIVTPALADANNGNWQTARRWARMLREAYRVALVDRWPPAGPGDGLRSGHAGALAADAGLMIALHARRSAPAIAAWRAHHPGRPLLLVLTGTDLYRDIAHDADARLSLQQADALVVLNELGVDAVPPAWRAKCQVLLQSCAAWQALAKPKRRMRVLMVGHLRDEKDPHTYFRCVARLAGRRDIRLDHIGAALDPALGAEAAACAAAHPGYRWLGALPHGTTRRHIQAAHLLVHPSKLEGGAHVVIEALRSGTPVLASRIDGNLGLLGPDYGGYFAPGDDAALAALIARARDDPAMLPALQQQVALRSPLFAPEAESATLRSLVARLLAAAPAP